jgi:hypothetical protein
MLAQIAIPVANVSDLLGLGYTYIEVWRSADFGNSFQEVTSSALAPAVATSIPASTTFLVGGKELRFQINGGAEVVVDFAALNSRWTPAQVVARINQAVNGLASLSSDGLSVVLTTSTTGRLASIVITYNEVDELGWSAGDLFRGTDARIPLINDTRFYTYTDLGGLSTDRYKWRFSKDGLPPISDFSAPVLPQPPLSNNSILGVVQFVDAFGQPFPGTLIIAAVDTDSINGQTIGSLVSRTFQAGADGLLAVPLLVGAKVRIGIEGTRLVREIVVPGPAGGSFDIMTALSTAPDAFTVQSTPPLLIRNAP